MKFDRAETFVPVLLKKLRMEIAFDDQDLILTIFASTASVKVDQDLSLVIFSQSVSAKVDQDLVLVIFQNPVGNATQLLAMTDPGFGFRPVVKRNHGLFQTASTPVFITNKVFPIVFCVT